MLLPPSSRVAGPYACCLLRGRGWGQTISQKQMRGIRGVACTGWGIGGGRSRGTEKKGAAVGSRRWREGLGERGSRRCSSYVGSYLGEVRGGHGVARVDPSCWSVCRTSKQKSEGIDSIEVQQTPPEAPSISACTSVVGYDNTTPAIADTTNAYTYIYILELRDFLAIININ